MLPLTLAVRKSALAAAFVLVLASTASMRASAGVVQSGRQPLITSKIDETQRVALPGHVRPEANAANDRGPVADSLALEHMQLILTRPAALESALDAYMEAAQTPGNPKYHQWLTAEEIGARFGPHPDDIAAVRGWLEAHGFRVNGVSASGLLIDFSGTAGQVAETFKTEIHSLDVKGERHFANMRDPLIPAALAPAVTGIASMNDFFPRPTSKPAVKGAASGPARLAGTPEFTVNANYQLVVPADLATIYNYNPVYQRGIAGRGQTIVVIEPTNLFSNDDYYTFRKTFGLDRYKESSFTVVHPGGCTDPGVVVGNDFEAAVDAEWAAASAPDANVVLASCANTSTTFGGFIAIQALVDSRHPPAIISLSYGECETDLGPAENRYIDLLYQQAAAEGVSLFVSTGDEGAASCDANQPAAQSGIAVSGLASTPYDLAAGGTDFSDTFSGTNGQYWNTANSPTYGSALSYIPEMPWDDSCANGPISTFVGAPAPYGASGFCNSALGEEFFLTTAAGSGGPSGCAFGETSPNPGTPAVSGTCRGYRKPVWQWFLAGVPQDGVRDIPDVSMFAANGLWGHYYVLCYSDLAFQGAGFPCTGTPDTWSGGGGTSFAAPVLAGVQALVNQKTGERQGNPNYVYYTFATLQYGFRGNAACDSNSGTNACIFHDVTFGDIDINCTGTFNCYDPSGPNGVLSVSSNWFEPAYGATEGWDFATGIGTVNVSALVNAWPR